MIPGTVLAVYTRIRAPIYLLLNQGHMLPCYATALQGSTVSAAERQQIAEMALTTIQTLRSDDSFDLFWQKVTNMATKLGVEEPKLPCQRRRPRRYDNGGSLGMMYMYYYVQHRQKHTNN